MEIDFLRGVAVILVLFRHHRFTELLKQAGWAGVDLFFVLSGFLVSGLLFSEYKKFGGIKPGLFLIRRGFKIYPLFYLMIGGSYARVIYMKLAEGVWSADPIKLFAETVFLQNYLGYLWPHTWSLAVEEHFYFALTLIIFLMIRNGTLRDRRYFTAMVLSVVVLCTSLRIYNNLNFEYTHLTHLFPTHFRFDSLLWGVFLSYNYHFHREQFKAFYLNNAKWILPLSLAFISILFFFEEKDPFMNSIGLTMLYFGFGSILVLMVMYERTNQLMEKYLSKRFYHWVGKVGYYSYSIYLWHICVLQYILPQVRKIYELPEKAEFILYAFLSIFFGIIISKLIEYPVLKIRDKYFPRRAAAFGGN